MSNKIQKSRPNLVIDDTGKIYPSIRKLRDTIHVKREILSKALSNGGFSHNGRFYKLYEYTPTVASESEEPTTPNPTVSELEQSPEYQEFLEAKKARAQEFQNYDIQLTHHKNGSR